MLVSDNSAAIMKIVGKRPAEMNRADWRAAQLSLLHSRFRDVEMSQTEQPPCAI